MHRIRSDVVYVYTIGYLSRVECGARKYTAGHTQCDRLVQNTTGNACKYKRELVTNQMIHGTRDTSSM